MVNTLALVMAVALAPGAKGEYEIVSYGRDGQPGGEGEAADIKNF